MELNEFWHGKKVFLTGHTGFKGGWLTIWLKQMGAIVTGYALDAATSPNFFETARVADGITSIIGDIRDEPALRAALVAAQPDIVFHLAAQPLVRRSYADPVETYSINVMGTAHLLNAIRQVPSVRAVVNVTTDKCYENREWEWGYREIDPMGGADPYSSSKGCAELVTTAFRSSYFNPGDYEAHGVAVATARAGNVIGGGDWSDARLVPDTIRAFEKNETVVIRSPHSIRPWQHVLEPLSGYLLLAQELFKDGPRVGEAWNFGPLDQDARPVQWIVEHLAQLFGQKDAWRLDDATHPHEARYLKLDCSKAKARLQWSPRWDLPRALGATVAWQRAFAGGEDMAAFSISQICEFTGQ